MKKHITFRVGGPAACFLTPSTKEQIREILHICQEEKTPYFILGNGSNLLVSDQGFDGVVLQADENAALNILDRFYDTQISRYATKEEVKRILLGRLSGATEHQ